MTLPWRLKYHNGSSFVDAELRRWNGSSWVVTNGYYWDGSDWVLLTDRTPPTSTFDTVWGSHYGASYQGNGLRRTDSNGLANTYQGYNTSTWGLQRGMWGLDVNLETHTSGLVAVYNAWLFFDNQHTWYNAGGTLGIGTHAFHSSTPAGAYGANRHNVHNVHFNKGEAKWVAISTDFGWWAAEGSFKGPVCFVNSTSSEFYGYYSNGCQLRLIYEK